jgi:hypothetical protein
MLIEEPNSHFAKPVLVAAVFTIQVWATFIKPTIK